MVLAVMATIRYEQPIRRFLNISYRDKFIQAKIKVKARQRLLNEPFFLITVHLLSNGCITLRGFAQLGHLRAHLPQSLG